MSSRKRTASQELRKVQGKTIKAASAVKHETSDGCFYAVLELRFTDGSTFSFTLRGMPQVDVIFFKDDDDSPRYGSVELLAGD